MRFVVVLAAALCVVARAADLPSGSTLFERYIESSGGKQAYEKVQDVSMSGTVEMAAQGISGSITVLESGTKSRTSMDLPGIGKIEEGFDGETAWANSLIQGPRIMEGDEKNAAMRAAGISTMNSWKSLYTSAKTVGSEDLNGKPAWKVEMTPAAGSVENFFFDKESGLLVRVTAVLSTALGEIPSDITMSDYRRINGVLTPYTMTEKAMGQTIGIHFDKIVFNSNLPPDRFEPPAEVKALRNKKQ